MAAQRYFYKAEELSITDIDFIEKVLLAPMPAFVRAINRDWLRTFNIPFQLLSSLRSTGISEQILEEKRKWLENNIIEDLHASIEADGLPYLDSLRRGDSEFFANEDERESFLIFLCAQYFRTSKIKANIQNSVAKASKLRLGFDFERIWNPTSHILATSTAYSLSRDRLHLILLENTSSVPFITGDQPVVNTYAMSVPSGDQVSNLEFYYPVSSEIAILITQNASRLPGGTSIVDETSANEFNSHIIGNSFREIYANSLEQLDAINIPG